MLGPRPRSPGSPRVSPLLSSLSISPGRPWLGGGFQSPQELIRENYLFTVNVDNIFGSRIFLPQWGPFWILQKGHYGLRKRREKGKLILAWKRGRWENREPAPFLAWRPTCLKPGVCNLRANIWGHAISSPTDSTAKDSKNTPHQEFLAT